MIRDAVETDAVILTEIAFKAKSHWNYPEEFIELWRDELTISEKYIENNFVRCCFSGERCTGFYSLVNVAKERFYGKVLVEEGVWLDHMFILPEFHAKGIGTGLFSDMKNRLEEIEAGVVRIFVDPFAEGFYRKMGAKLLRMSESSIPGRMIPVYIYETRFKAGTV